MKAAQSRHGQVQAAGNSSWKRPLCSDCRPTMQSVTYHNRPVAKGSRRWIASQGSSISSVLQLVLKKTHCIFSVHRFLFEFSDLSCPCPAVAPIRIHTYAYSYRCTDPENHVSEFQKWGFARKTHVALPIKANDTQLYEFLL